MVGLSTNKAFCRANINSFLFEYMRSEIDIWNVVQNQLIIYAAKENRDIAIWKCWWPFVTGCRCQRCLRICKKKFLATLLFFYVLSWVHSLILKWKLWCFHFKEIPDPYLSPTMKYTQKCTIHHECNQCNYACSDQRNPRKRVQLYSK